MKFSKKDILIIGIPVIIMILLMPILPDKIPMQWDHNGNVNWDLDKKFSFVLGLFPFVLYKLHKIKKG